MEHHRAFGERQDDLHDVLDDDQRDAARVDAAHQADRRLHLGRIEAGQGLVQQQQPRLGRQRARDLQPLAPRRAEHARAPVGHCVRPVKASTSSAACARPGAARMAQEGADQDVFDDRHVLERHRHLEGARDAKPGMRLRPRACHVMSIEAGCARRWAAGRRPAR